MTTTQNDLIISIGSRVKFKFTNFQGTVVDIRTTDNESKLYMIHWDNQPYEDIGYDYGDLELLFNV